jgi:lysophospholipase L1-like esterase
MMENIKPIYYLALGDSLTEGFGEIRSVQTFVLPFFEYLRRTEYCRVRNWGVSGITSEELLAFISNPAVIRLLPKLTHLTITIGGCDFITTYEKESMTFDKLFHTFRRVQHHIKQMLQIIRWNNSEVIVRLLGFYLPIPIYDRGVKKASMFIQAMNDYYAQLCCQYNAQLINPLESFLHRFDYFYDEVHPNQTGHDQIAKLFIASIGQPSTSLV